MRRVLPSLLAVISVLTVPTSAQQELTPEALDRSVAFELAAWQREYGPAWQAQTNAESGYVDFLYGGGARLTLVPGTDADFFAAARQAIAAAQSMFGIENATLIEDRALFLPLGQIGTTDKMTVRFRQVLDGIPVTHGWMNALFAMDGRLLSLQTTAIPELVGFDTSVGFSADSALRKAAETFALETGVQANILSAPELVIDHDPARETLTAALAWRIDLQWQEVGIEPEGYTYFVDAKSGAVLRKERNIHFLDVTGNVTTFHSSGLAPDIPSNPEVIVPMVNAWVESPLGTFVTDQNGDFTVLGVDSIDGLVFSYLGAYSRVRNVSGTDFEIVPGTVSGSGNNFLLNPSTTTEVTPQANAYVATNQLRDWIRSVIPGDSSADFRALAKVNINDSCNAFFDGSSTNYFQAAGSCSNTAYSTIVAHEMGHWLNVIYGTGNGFGGMGEGNADVFAMYLYDTAVVGQNFNGSGFVRTGNNTRQFCGECCEACYGEVHADGEPWMGAAWKLRENLKSSMGAGQGSLAADLLFLGWMNAYNQSRIKSVIENQWLTLDDDDASILDGSPHYGDINGAFLTQGFAGFPLPSVAISGVTELTTTVDEVGPYTIQATIEATLNPPVTSATLFYRTGAGAFTSIPMTNVGGNDFSADIPGQPEITIVEYYIEAADNNSAQSFQPQDGPGDPLNFSVGDLGILFQDTFQTDKSWTVVSTDITTGEWERVTPRGTFNNNDIVAPFSDSASDTGGRCFITEQGEPISAWGAADLDGGPTVLTSPLIDYEGFDGVIRYSYWLFSNQTDDSITVEISNNNGSSWTQVRQHTGGAGGWKQIAFVISDFVTPSNQIRVRFSAADNPNNSITEAGIDDFIAETLGPIPILCVDPVNFCTAVPNSTGLAASVDLMGSTSIAANNARLVAGPVPVDTGLFIYSLDPDQTPVGNGNLCIGGQTLGFLARLGGVLADPLGFSTFDLDLNNPPAPEAQITPGTTWYFQYWYRDHPAGGAEVNFSDGMEILFCP